MNNGFDLFMKEAARQDSSTEYCEDSKNSLAHFRAIQGHSGGIPIDPELMEYIRILSGFAFNIQSILENGVIPGGKESDKGRQTIFCTPLNPFGVDSDEEEPSDDYTIPQKVY